ncbi:MAG: ComF family protein [Deltaproteobacteria bacterium]|nr:ComF family protein [Deltaproteobacteria bacterium]
MDIYAATGALLDLLFPRRCLVCAVFLSHPLSYPSPDKGLEPYLCFACRHQLHLCAITSEQPKLLQGEKVFSGYLYGGALGKIIPLWKYQARNEFFPLIRMMLTLALTQLESSALDCDLIVALPLTPRALRKRGFNQAFFIASSLALFLERPLGRNLLRKIADTPRQASLDRQARLHNVRSDIFQVSDPARIAGRHILLCDDVLTTGTTLSAAAGALKNAGAGRVTAFTLARVPPA